MAWVLVLALGLLATRSSAAQGAALHALLDNVYFGSCSRYDSVGALKGELGVTWRVKAHATSMQTLAEVPQLSCIRCTESA